jgi:hypothetical protein
MSKKCGECANFDRSLSKCDKIQDDSIRENDTVICCPFYELKPPTVFVRITASPEVLAPALVHIIVCEEDTSLKGWTSNIVMSVFETYEEAIAATVAKLKEIME